MIYVYQHFTNDDFTSFFLVSENTLLKSPKYMQIIFILMWIGQIIRERLQLFIHEDNVNILFQ